MAEIYESKTKRAHIDTRRVHTKKQALAESLFGQASDLDALSLKFPLLEAARKDAPHGARPAHGATRHKHENVRAFVLGKIQRK